MPAHCSHTHLFVAQPRHRVDVLLLDHEGCQVGCVGRQEDDSEEGPDQHHDLTGGAFWILNGDGVVEDDSPQQPHWLPDCEGGPPGIWPQGTELLAVRTGRDQFDDRYWPQNKAVTQLWEEKPADWSSQSIEDTMITGLLTAVHSRMQLKKL